MRFFVPTLPRRELLLEGSAKASLPYAEAFDELRGEVYQAAVNAGLPPERLRRPIVQITIHCKRRGRDGHYRPLSVFEAQVVSKPVVRALAELDVIATDDASTVIYRLQNDEGAAEGILVSIREEPDA